MTLFLVVLLMSGSVTTDPAGEGPSSPVVKKSKPEQVICRRDVVTGSRVVSVRTCKTAAGWRAASDAAREDARRAQQGAQTGCETGAFC